MHQTDEQIKSPEKIVKRSVSIKGHRTSISLEEAFWDELKTAAQEHKISVNQLIGKVDETRTGGLSSALRLFVLEKVKQRLKF